MIESTIILGAIVFFVIMGLIGLYQLTKSMKKAGLIKLNHIRGTK